MFHVSNRPQELDESLHHVAMNMESCSGRGSELFAKRKKRSDKWVVDESNLGASPIPPSAHADKFVQQQMMAQVRCFFPQRKMNKYQQGPGLIDLRRGKLDLIFDCFGLAVDS